MVNILNAKVMMNIINEYSIWEHRMREVFSSLFTSLAFLGKITPFPANNFVPFIN